MEDKDLSQRVRLDEILKSLFAVSKRVLLAMMNSLFKENFDVETAEVTFENNEFVTDEYDIIRGDLFLKILQEDKPYHYHIELQTANDSTMIIRMFEYGFNKAKELARYGGVEETVIYIPKQLVIFIEQNKNIQDELKMRLVFPEGQEVRYIVPVIKLWKFDDKDILAKKMYPLLPLQVFKLRNKMEQLKRNQESELQKVLLEARRVAEVIAKEGKQLYENQEINGDDLHKILLAIANLFEYLNDRYGDDKKLEEEVRTVTKTLYDPAVEQRGIEKGTEKIILLLLEQKLKSVPSDYKEKIEKLSQEQLNKIAINIFNIEKIEDIDKILR